MDRGREPGDPDQGRTARTTGSRPGSWPRSPTPWATPTRAGYVHRDIKPANILLDPQGRAYLTDFGIAVVEEDLLRDVTAAGTLPYMAPEQLDEGLGPVDHRADLYALGVVLYELLTGRRPFRAATPMELREQILAGDPPPPRSIEPDVPEELERICLRCLAKRPEDRYQGADEVACGSEGLSGTVRHPKPTPRPRRTRHRARDDDEEPPTRCKFSVKDRPRNAVHWAAELAPESSRGRRDSHRRASGSARRIAHPSRREGTE